VETFGYVKGYKEKKNMSTKGPNLIEGEAEGVIEFLLDYAKKNSKKDFNLKVQELKHLFVGAPDPIYHMNRIRWNMRKEMNDAGIKFKCLGDSYNFTIENFEEPEEVMTSSSSQVIYGSENIETSTNYQDEFIPPFWFSDLIATLKCGDKPILIGPHGCGKSRILEEAYKFLGRKMFRVALGESRDPADLIGTKEIVNENGVPVTKFVGGILTQAMQEGQGIILDEYDMCSPMMIAAFNKIMEPGIEMTLQTEKGLETFRPHPKTLIAATSNTWGKGDYSGEYSGAQKQNDSAWDRIRPKIPCGYDEAVEEMLIRRFLPIPVVNALYNNSVDINKTGIVRLIRDAIKDPMNPLEDVLSFRSILWFAHRWNVLKWHKGMFYMLQDFKEENKESIALIIKNRLGQNFAPSRNDYNSREQNYIPNMESEIRKQSPGFLD